MKKKLLVVIFTVISLFAYTPVSANALTVDDIGVFMVDQNASDPSGLMDGYNQEQTCTGGDSILGDPNDENSVAWLLNKILTYATIIGMILVVVLSSIDFTKVIVKGDDEAMQKAVKKLAMRLLLAALLFFVPTITNVVLDVFGLTSESTCGIGQ